MKKLLAATTFALALSVTSGSQAAPMTFTTEAAFLAAATGIPLSTESFESLPNNSPSPVNLGPLSLSVADGGVTGTDALFTDGTRSWGVGGVFGADFPATITFSTPVNAVGFDILGELTVATLLEISINGGSPILSLGTGVPFIGIVDLTSPIFSVTISQNAQSDGMGIDRLQYGASVPEPGSMSLLALGVGVFALSRRRWFLQS